MHLHTIAEFPQQVFLMKALGKAVLSLFLLAAPGSALAQTFHADYSITLLGMPVGKATFVSSFNGDSFAIDGKMSSAGIANLFARTSGTAKVEGSIGRNGASPKHFSSQYQSGKKNSVTAIRFSGGKVASYENTPEPRKGESWIDVATSHLAGALDPLSATLIRTQDPAKVCGRTIRFFDGELRGDLSLAAPSLSDNGTVTCRASFSPVTGYRKGKKQIEYMRSKSRMSITFAQLGSTGFFAPVSASVGTQIGTVRIAATKIVAR